MDRTRRIALFAFFIGLIVFLGLLFAPFVVANILQPFALTLWLFLRIFILSIDQVYVWGLLVLAGLFFAIRRLAQGIDTGEQDGSPITGDALSRLNDWRSNLRAAAKEAWERNGVKQELSKLLVSLISLKPQSAFYYETYKPLQDRQIPLPEGVYRFLFPQEPKNDRPFNKIIFHPLRDFIRKLNGRETAEYYQAVHEVISYMETSLEIKNDE